MRFFSSTYPACQTEDAEDGTWKEDKGKEAAEGCPAASPWAGHEEGEAQEQAGAS